MGVAPAGTQAENTDHRHLTIDADLPDLNAPLPKDDNYRHFGGGQTKTTIKLEPSEHTLQLLLGDWKHILHESPVVSDKITITA